NFFSFFRSLGYLPALSYAAVALLLLGGAAWLIRDSLKLRSQLSTLRAEQQSHEEERRRLEEQFASEKARNETLTAQVEQQKKETAAPSLRPGTTQSVSPESPSGIVALILMPGLVRGGGNVPKLTLTPTARTVSLNVNIDPRDDYPRFSVELSAQ